MFYNNLLILLRSINIFTNYNIRAKPKNKTYNKAYTHLTYNLPFSFQSILLHKMAAEACGHLLYFVFRRATVR